MGRQQVQGILAALPAGQRHRLRPHLYQDEGCLRKDVPSRFNLVPTYTAVKAWRRALSFLPFKDMLLYISWDPLAVRDPVQGLVYLKEMQM